MSTHRTGLVFAAYQAHRVAQTCTTFQNWPVLLRQMAAEKFGRGATTLEFVTRGGARLDCPNVPGARLPMYEQFADDCYDLAWFLGTTADTPIRVLDVGSHVGAFAVNVGLARPNVQIECYEPSPDSARYLQANIEKNKLADRVRVHRHAMAAKEGTALLDDNSGGSVHNGLVRAEHRLVDGDESLDRRAMIEVPTTTFDQACTDGPFDLVKMDCEGGEYELVYASSPQSWASVQRMVMEYHPVAGESWDTLRHWFSEVGLRVVRHKADRPGLGTAWLARG